MTTYDIAIIGGGPAGSQAAYRLSLLGYKTAVFEKQSEVGNKLCCTGIIGKECMDIFEISHDCVLREEKSAKLFAPCGDFIRVSKEEPQAYIVDRPFFDRMLAQKAQDAGAEYLFQSNVIDITVFSDRVELTLQQNKAYQCKVAIIANGFASKLPYKLGMGQIKNMIAGVQAEVETNRIDEVEVYFSHKTAPGFFAWLAPISASRARVGLFAKANPISYLKILLAQLVTQGKITSANVEFTHGGIPLKPLPKTYSERTVIVGDSAGQVKPTTGGGIYYGMLCANFAAETLNQAFQTNDFSKKKLSQYEKLWKAKLGRELRIDYFARQFYNRLSDKRIDSIFRIVRDNNIHEDLLKSSYKSFDWHGELVLDGLKQLGPWRKLFANYLPKYIMNSMRTKPK